MQIFVADVEFLIFFFALSAFGIPTAIVSAAIAQMAWIEPGAVFYCAPDIMYGLLFIYHSTAPQRTQMMSCSFTRSNTSPSTLISLPANLE